MLGIGLQHKSVEDLEKELQLPPNQLLAMFNKIVKKIISLLEEINVNQINKLLFKDDTQNGNEMSAIIDKMQPLKQSLEEELNEVSLKVKADEREQKKQLLSNSFDMKQYAIKGSENEWVDALKLPTTSSYVTVKRYNFFKSNFATIYFVLGFNFKNKDWVKSEKLISIVILTKKEAINKQMTILIKKIKKTSRIRSKIKRIILKTEMAQALKNQKNSLKNRQIRFNFKKLFYFRK